MCSIVQHFQDDDLSIVVNGYLTFKKRQFGLVRHMVRIKGLEYLCLTVQVSETWQ